MKVKTYRTRTLEEALTSIKQDLGSEALILSTRSVPRPKPLNLFSPPKWEVTAALKEPEQDAVPAKESVAAKPAVRKQAVAAGFTPASPGAAIGAATALAPARDRRIDELLEEMDDLKRSVRLIGKAMPSGKNSELGSPIYNEMIAQGIDSELADRLITSASRGNPTNLEIRDRVRRMLADMLVIEAPAELQARGRIVSIFVGPTGVGKTTTIAKIAGHATARFNKKVALISTDTLRVGGHEQLSRFGALLNIPVYPCSDVTTLNSLIESLEDADLVLVDTPGASPSDLARLGKLEAVLSAPNARVNLVISATTRSEDINRIIKRYQKFAPKRVVFTKMDETDSRAAVIGDLLRNELAITYMTNGQRVPEDLLLPKATELAGYVLPTETRR